MTTQQAYDEARLRIEKRVQRFVKTVSADPVFNQKLENGDDVVFDSEVRIDQISSTSSEVYIRLRLSALNLAALNRLAALYRDGGESEESE